MAISGKTMGRAQTDVCLLVEYPSGLQGNTELFIETLGGIRLMDTAAGKASLWNEVKKSDAETLELEAFMAFPPSTSNFLELKVITEIDSSGSDNGFLFHLGESGSEDRIEVYSMEGGVKKDLLSQGKYIHGASSNVVVSWRVEIHGDTLMYFSREKRGLRWRKEGEFIHSNSEISIIATGLELKYSSTRRDKFWFYKWCTGNLVKAPPKIEYWKSYGPGNCRFYFGEPIVLSNEFSAIILPEQDPPVELITDSLDKGLLHLVWDEENFGVRQGPIVVRGLVDTLGRLSGPDTVPVFWELPEKANSHVIISEIMADPEPSRGWPASEFVELTNFGPDTIEMIDWELADAKSAGRIESFIFPPESSVILVPPDWTAVWGRAGANAVGVDKWPGLNNGQDQVGLINSTGQRIDSVFYDISLIEPYEKRGGGWSIIRDPDPCARNPVWYFSPGETGCSPSMMNESQLYPCPEKKIEAISSESQLTLNFSGGPVELPGVEHITITPELDLVNIDFGNNKASWELTFNQIMEYGRMYSMTCRDVLSDTCGNFRLPARNPVHFGLAVAPDSGMLLINEVLFSSTGETSFIEIYNNSDRILSTSDLIINFPELGEWIAIDAGQEIYPSSYVAFSSFPCLTYQVFNSPDSASVEFQNGISKINGNDSLLIELLYVTGLDWEVLDRIIFNRDWHPASLGDPGGRSLCRIDPDQSGLLKSNWRSSLPPGLGGTPGWRNFPGNEVNLKKGKVSFSGSLSPSNPELTWQLDWELKGKGWEMRVEVFSFRGQYLGIIQPSGPITSAGQFKWSYSDLSDLILSPGVYLFSITCWNTDGKYQRFTEYALAIQ